jgi:peptidoglycan hydrolase CwlO-like protein
MKPISILPSSNEEPQGNPQAGHDETNRLGETIDQTQRDLKRTRQEFGDQIEKHSRHVRVVWAIVILLVLGLAGMAWYGYTSIDNHSAALAQLPGLQKLASAIDNRLSATEGKMNDWAGDRAALTARMAKLETTLASNIRTVRNQAQSAATQAAQKIRVEINQDLQRLQNRIVNVESVQRETQEQIASAQNEIGSLKQEIASLQKQNAQRTSDIQQTQTDVDKLNGQVSAMNDQVTVHTLGLKALNNEVDRTRIDFEVSSNKTQQVAPQIYVTINHIDVGRQKVDGWMQLADEGRIVWIRSLGAQQALTFVTRSDNRTHELVFTAIQDSGVTGYLLLPRSPRTPAASAN